jgi:hypothetical protein
MMHSTRDLIYGAYPSVQGPAHCSSYVGAPPLHHPVMDQHPVGCLPKSELLLKNVPVECSMKDVCSLFSQYGTVTKVVKRCDIVDGAPATTDKLEISIWPTKMGIQQLAALDKHKLMMPDGICVEVESFETFLVNACVAAGNNYTER